MSDHRSDAEMDEPLLFRDREAVAAYFAGLEMVEPGLVPVDDWRPDAELVPPDGDADPLHLGVGRTAGGRAVDALACSSPGQATMSGSRPRSASMLGAGTLGTESSGSVTPRSAAVAATASGKTLRMRNRSRAML